MTTGSVTLRRLLSVALAIAGTTVLLPAAATSAQDDVVSWTSPTPREGAVLGVAAKTTLSFRLGATSDGSDAAAIRDSGSPPGAILRHTDGNPASATYTWKPPVAQVGVPPRDVHDDARTRAARPARSSSASVGPTSHRRGRRIRQRVYPQRRLLSDRGLGDLRLDVRQRTARSHAPAHRSGAHAITPVTFRTPELYRNAIQVLNQVTYKGGKTWVRIRLAVLPERHDRLGAARVARRVPEGAHADGDRRSASQSHALQARPARLLDADRRRAGAARRRRGRVLRAREALRLRRAGVRPTRVRAQREVRDTLTDWPGGGFVGIHGTNGPQILPGRVSHGCVRMRNPAILRLFRLMPLGTPVSIR